MRCFSCPSIPSEKENAAEKSFYTSRFLAYKNCLRIFFSENSFVPKTRSKVLRYGIINFFSYLYKGLRNASQNINLDVFCSSSN